jgi:hypothetical protein
MRDDSILLGNIYFMTGILFDHDPEDFVQKMLRAVTRDQRKKKNFRKRLPSMPVMGYNKRHNFEAGKKKVSLIAKSGQVHGKSARKGRRKGRNPRRGSDLASLENR